MIVAIPSSYVFKAPSKLWVRFSAAAAEPGKTRVWKIKLNGPK